jgi:D-inositol-3-phosphate glycosyltransferase
MDSLAGKAEMVIVTSKTVARHVKEELNLSNNRIEVLYPPIDTDLYRPRDKTLAKLALNCSKEAKKLLYIGNIRKTRFPDDWVFGILSEIKKQYPEILLSIYAPSTSENQIRKYEMLRKARMLGILRNVSIHVENLSERQISMVYADADAFLFPSMENGGAVEPPLTVLEAMSSGTPVLATNTLSLGEIIRDNENGLIVCPADRSELVDRLSMLFVGSHEAEEYSRNARKTIVETVSLKSAGAKLDRLYVSLSNTRKIS